MFLYEKKIGYLSRYQNGEKQDGAGFIKILREKDAYILDIHIQSNLKMLNGNYTLLLLLDRQETAWEQISLREGKGNIHRKIMLRNKMLCIGDILYNEETLWGIKLFLDGQSWISGNFKEKRKELTAAVASEKEEAPDKTEAGQNEKIIQGCQQPIQFRSCPYAKEKAGQNDVRHARDSRLQSKAGMEDNNVRYEEIKEKLKKNLNTKGWDGRWFKRAVTDDGEELGSINSEECRIDSISQSWSVISGAGENDKKFISMQEAENYLVDRENKIIKLFDPAFDKGKVNPGYIKAYPPGIRENGGQYTHAATWFIMAEAILGFGDKAVEFAEIINPINHTKTKDEAKKFKLEPYILPADVYSNKDLLGRGGWNWYTGSSSWYFKVVIEYILGLKIKDGYLYIEPCISKNWKEYEIKYKYKTSLYNIKVKNSNSKNTGVTKFILNNDEITEKRVLLQDNGKINNIEIVM